MVELGDAHGFPVHLHHVVVAVGVERVPAIVGGEGDRHAGGAEFVHHGDAAPARGAALCSALQIHVAHRQVDDVQARVGAEGDRRRCLFFRLDGQGADVADLDWALGIFA